VKPKVGGHFNFKHGSLFILHPRDEKPTIRYGLEKYGSRFFKHSCKGVKNIKNGLSIGIAFRTTKHLAEVNSDTGCVVLNNTLEINIIGIGSEKKMKTDSKKEAERKESLKRDKVIIESYWSGQREVDELHIKSLWKKCKEKHFRSRARFALQGKWLLWDTLWTSPCYSHRTMATPWTNPPPQ
jgi:hypothetical protein